MSIDANRSDAEVSSVRYRSDGTTVTSHYHAGVAVECTCSTPDDVESSMDDVESHTDEVEPEVEEIRSEIEHTRSEMSQTIDAIQDRLSPRRLVQEAQETVREATVGKAERMMTDASDAATEMVGSAGDTARGFGTGLVDAVRRNPVAALVTGVGLGWLFMSARKGEEDDYDRYYREGASRAAGRAAYYPPYGARPTGTTSSGYGRGYSGTGYGRGYSGGRYATGYARGYGDYEYDEDRDGGMVDRVGSAASDVQDRASEMASRAGDKLSNTASNVADRVSGTTSQVQDRASELADQVQDRAGELTGQVRENLDEWTDMAQERFYDARSEYDRMLEENPLAVGAVALALGVAVGMALPSTPHEDRMLGPARDRLMDQAQEVAQDTAEKVQRVVGEVQNTAKEEAQKQGLMGQPETSSSPQSSKPGTTPSSTTSSQQPTQAQGVRG
jgi:ElaB/YqjD/DUF883 family membrane-anchored ribosome-binding protein/uncharacterized protein YoxC